MIQMASVCKGLQMHNLLNNSRLSLSLVHDRSSEKYAFLSRSINTSHFSLPPKSRKERKKVALSAL